MTKTQKREIFDVILGDLESGKGFKESCSDAGVTDVSVYKWIELYPDWADLKHDATIQGKQLKAAKEKQERAEELLEKARAHIVNALEGKMETRIRKTMRYVPNEDGTDYEEVPFEKVVTKSPMKLPDAVMLAAFNELARLSESKESEGEVMRPPDIIFALKEPKQDAE